MSGIALILAGHGSHISGETAGIVWGYVDRLRAWGVADEITACFWKEPPAYSQVLETVAADDIVIVPVFTARGYFSSEVIPTEMGLGAGVNVREDKRIHLTPTIGEHPHLEAIVDKRLRDIVAMYGLSPRETAAAIIGHGTPRNRHSRDAARQQADRVREINWLREVVAVYLDDKPDIPSVYASTTAAHIIALPYFLAPGSHVTRDLPRALGISGLRSPEVVDGRAVYYAEPVGSDETICQVILQLARGTNLSFAPERGTCAWGGFPQAGRQTLLNALETARILNFGQLMVSEERVWHGDEVADSIALDSPAALRAFLRERPFRPLPTSRDLPGAWHVDLAHPAQAHAVIETIYPGLIADWAAQRHGTLKIESLQAIGSRQDGMFKDIHKLPEEIIRKAISKVCGNCIRQPSWWSETGPASAGLPCRAACNLWLSTARKIGDAA